MKRVCCQTSFGNRLFFLRLSAENIQKKLPHTKKSSKILCFFLDNWVILGYSNKKYAGKGIFMTELKGESPKSLVIARKIRENIRKGVLAPGECLESSRILAQKWGVGRQVLRSAVAALSQEGLLKCTQGVGVFVADPLPEGFGARKKHLTVGLVIWKGDISHNFSFRTCQELMKSSLALDCTLQIAPAFEKEEELLGWIFDNRPDGLILCGELSDTLLEKLEENRVFFMLLGNLPTKKKVHRFEKDLVGNVEKAFDMLLEHYGFSRVFLLIGPQKNLGTKQVLKAVEKSCRKFSIPLTEDHIKFHELTPSWKSMEYFMDNCKLGKGDMVYLTPDTFPGAARAIFERGLKKEARPFLCLDAVKGAPVSYPDLVDHYIYEYDGFYTDALSTFLTLYRDPPAAPWRGIAKSILTKIDHKETPKGVKK